MKKIKKLSKSDVEFLILVTLLIIGFLFVKFFNVNKENYEFVFLGDSITYRYDLQKYYSNYPVVNSGINGNRTVDILENLDNRVYKYNPDKIIILIGVNDLAHNQPTEYVFSNIKKITKDIKNKFPKSTIYIQSIYPVNSTWKEYASEDSPSLDEMISRIKEVNKKIEVYCKNNNFEYIDVYSSLIDNDGVLKNSYTVDGIHLSDEGYRIVTYIIKKRILD